MAVAEGAGLANGDWIGEGAASSSNKNTGADAEAEGLIAGVAETLGLGVGLGTVGVSVDSGLGNISPETMGSAVQAANKSSIENVENIFMK